MLRVSNETTLGDQQK